MSEACHPAGHTSAHDLRKRVMMVSLRAMAALVRATEASGLTDSEIAQRLGCRREHFNRVKNGGQACLTHEQLFIWAVLVGADVIVGSQQGQSAGADQAIKVVAP